MSNQKLQRVLVLIPVALLCGALATPVLAAPPSGDLSAGWFTRAWDFVMGWVPDLSISQNDSESLRAQVGADESGPGADPWGDPLLALPRERSLPEEREQFALPLPKSGAPTVQ